jgi:hypothetical protein
MTLDNLGRVTITAFFVVATIFTGFKHINLFTHIAFALCSIALIARVIYAYIKGE